MAHQDDWTVFKRGRTLHRRDIVLERDQRELDRSYAKPAVEQERYHFLAGLPKLRPQPLKLQLPEASKF